MDSEVIKKLILRDSDSLLITEDNNTWMRGLSIIRILSMYLFFCVIVAYI